MLLGIPFSQYQLSKNKTARSLAVMLILVGTIQMLAPSQSVMERMQSKLLSIGKGPIKSKVMLLPQWSGTGNGCKGLAGFVVGDLLCKHSMQDGMYACSRSWCMLGQ